MQALSSDLQADRRRHTRASLSLGCSVATRAADYGLFWTLDLSPGGALLGSGRIFERGTALQLHLHPPVASTIALRARVAHQHRARRGTQGFGVVFEYDYPAQRELVDSLLANSQRRRLTSAQARRTTALVMADNALLARALARDLEGLGVRTISAHTPLDATWHLTTGGIDMLFIHRQPFGDHLLAWLEQLQEHFPQVTRVLLADVPIVQGLSSLLIDGRLGAVLAAPWKLEYLEETVQAATRPTFMRGHT
jgi:hypothetical protein